MHSNTQYRLVQYFCNPGQNERRAQTDTARRPNRLWQPTRREWRAPQAQGSLSSTSIAGQLLFTKPTAHHSTTALHPPLITLSFGPVISISTLTFAHPSQSLLRPVPLLFPFFFSTQVKYCTIESTVHHTSTRMLRDFPTLSRTAGRQRKHPTAASDS